jgi:hypothetical protein
MIIRIDPENNETRALFDMLNVSGQRVLEIRCGDGRLTCWTLASWLEYNISRLRVSPNVLPAS